MLYILVWAMIMTTGSCGQVRARKCPKMNLGMMSQGATKPEKDDHTGGNESNFRIDSTGRPKDKSVDFNLEILTMNVTSWGAAKEFLLTTTANLICIQEHKLWGDKLAEASRWAETQGWTVVWGPARANEEESGSSGGVAIFARNGVGLVDSEAQTKYEHRLVGAWVEAPGYDRFLIHSAYFCVRAGLSGINAEIMGEIVHEFQSKKAPGYVGADWNVEPQDLLAAEVTERAGAALITHGTQYGTCTAGKGEKTLDYFMAFGGVENGPRKSRCIAAQVLRPTGLSESLVTPRRWP